MRSSLLGRSTQKETIQFYFEFSDVSTIFYEYLNFELISGI
jgi:hypothetical protein